MPIYFIYYAYYVYKFYRAWLYYFNATLSPPKLKSNKDTTIEVHRT